MEKNLQLGIGEQEDVAIEQGAQPHHARLAAKIAEPRAERLGVDQLTLVCVVHRPLERAPAEHGSEVNQRANRSRNRDSALFHHICFG